MNFLFPVDATALTLKYHFDNFLLSVGHPEMVPNITVNKCRLLAQAIVCRELRHWFQWYELEMNTRKLTRVFGDYPREFFEVGYIAGALARLMPGYEQTIGVPVSRGEGDCFFSELDNQVLDPIAGGVNQIMMKLLTEPTWKVCVIKPLGNNLMLEFKGDYRIWDWHYSRGDVRHTWDTNH
jgi:hypothetical protein